MQLETVKNGITVYRPTTEDGFSLNGRLWTISSPAYLPWKGAIQFCQDRSTQLQTLDDAVEFRHATNGAPDSCLAQWTRTLICQTPDGHAGNRAYIFEPNDEELQLLLARPEIAQNEAYALLDVEEDLGKRVKRFADKTGRIFIVPQNDLKLDIHPDASGQSTYGTSTDVKALMPNRSEQNAQYILANQDKIHQIYRGFGCVWFDRSDLKKGQMMVRPVGLGGDDNYGDIFDVGAIGNFNGSRRARGVASAR